MATLLLISDFCTDEECVAIFDRYLEMFDALLSFDDTVELDDLLALAACWNICLSIRPTLTEAANKAVSIEYISLPEKRVNHIAAEIHSQLDILTGKYADFDNRIA